MSYLSFTERFSNSGFRSKNGIGGLEKDDPDLIRQIAFIRKAFEVG